MSNKKPQSTIEAFEQLEAAWRDLMFAVAQATGILWLVGKIPGLEYKTWVKERLK